MKDGSIGYWHSFDSERPRKWVPKETKEPPKIDAEKMSRTWYLNTTNLQRRSLSVELGVCVFPLTFLRASWSPEHKAWAFPMRDGNGHITGIRLRASDGRKWSVSGSRQGLFVPMVAADKRLFIVEGPTDCAAMMSIGLYCVGRPSCSGGALDIKQHVHINKIEEVVIIADNDDDKHAPDGRKFNPGMDGALSLQRQIPIRSCIITVTTKDVREFVKMRGSAKDIEDLTKDVIWQSPDAR